MRPGLRSTLPASGARLPAMVRSRVVLPPPLGPLNATTSPLRPARSTALTTPRPAKPAVTFVSDQAKPPEVDECLTVTGSLDGSHSPGANDRVVPPLTR